MGDLGLQVNIISFCDIVNYKISKREFTFRNKNDRMQRLQGSITNMSNKGINTCGKDKELLQQAERQQNKMRQAHSRDETTQICKVDLPIATYGELVQLALRQGCTPEELVAQQIKRIIRSGIR